MAEPAKTSAREVQEPPEVAELWERMLVTTDKGAYIASVSNLELILVNDTAWKGKIRYDQRTDRIMVEPGCPLNDGTTAREFRDSDDARIASWLERSSKYAIRVSPSSASLLGAINIAAEQNRYDDVHAYLESLEWDKHPRLERLCPDYFGADDTAVNQAFGKLWMVSGAARVYEPGCQVDHVLALVGAQGLGKSTALRTIARRAEWFADSLPAAIGGRDAAEYLRGPWIVELAELDAFGRAEVTAIKAFVTRRHDRFRAAYARRTASHGRRSIFAASTNEESFLRDATGNRRFWPVTIGVIDLASLERDVDQLWAEAVHRYKNGEPWHLTDPEIVAAALEAQDERFQTDAWEPAIAAYLKRAPKIEGFVRVTIGEVLEHAIGLEIERWDQVAQNRAARCLQHLKWERVQRRDGEIGKDDEKKRRWAYEAKL